jgi:hypothetical protein
MGNAAPPSWLHIGRQSLLLNHQLTGLFRRLPSIGPCETLRRTANTMASGFPTTILNNLEARPTWYFLTGTAIRLAASSHDVLMLVSIRRITRNFRRTFTGYFSR